MAAQKQRGSAGSWVLWLIGGLILLGALLKSGSNSSSLSSYSPTTGKPYDMPQPAWDYTTNRLKQGTDMSRSESEEAARAIWKFEQARQAREGR